MAAVKSNRLTNANIYLNGNNYLGRAEEVMTPAIKQKMTEQKSLGMNGLFELAVGVEKLEGKIKWNSFYADALLAVADPTKFMDLQVRSSLETWDSNGKLAEVPCVIDLRAQSKDFPGNTFKQHDNVDSETNLNILYYKLRINGQDIVEYDVLSNIHKVGGVDILAQYRNNLGI